MKLNLLLLSYFAPLKNQVYFTWHKKIIKVVLYKCATQQQLITILKLATKKTINGRK